MSLIYIINQDHGDTLTLCPLENKGEYHLGMTIDNSNGDEQGIYLSKNQALQVAEAIIKFCKDKE
jgi:hypothetical protein